MLLLAEFQSAGTTQVVPEVRKITFGVEVANFAGPLSLAGPASFVPCIEKKRTSTMRIKI